MSLRAIKIPLLKTITKIMQDVETDFMDKRHESWVSYVYTLIDGAIVIDVHFFPEVEVTLIYKLHSVTNYLIMYLRRYN